jgi:hypothetical protein
MIKEDAPGGMAVDGMGGTGFTSTGNVAGIALGMRPIDQEEKKKKKKKKDLNVTENIVALVEKDLAEGVHKGKFIFKDENPHPSMAKSLEPEGEKKIEGSETLLDKVRKEATAFGQLRVKKIEPVNSTPVATVTDLKSSVDEPKEPVITESPLPTTPVDHPYYVPKFNMASMVGTADQSLHMNRVPGSVKGPRSRAKLAYILGGLGGTYTP